MARACKRAVIGVRLKHDTRPYAQREAEDYLAAGVRVVWLADPGAETITVFKPDQEPRILRGEDVLTADELIPGFRLRVADAFVV